MRHALVSPQDAVVRIGSNINPNVQTKPGWRWLPVVVSPAPNSDPAIEIVEGPTYTVGATQVTEAWTKRSLTAQELDERKESKLDAYEILTLRILFNHENRLRAIQGVSAATTAQFRAFLKNNL